VMKRRAEEQKAAVAAKAAAVAAEDKRRAGYNLTTMELRSELESLGLKPANEEEQMEMSAAFNSQLKFIVPGKGATRTWLTLFKAVDVDNSGLITYDEFVIVVRQKLKLSKTDMSDMKVKALWVALDTDAGNQISSAEFGRFMRLHQPHKVTKGSKQTGRLLPPANHLGKAKPLPPPPGSNRPSGIFAEVMKRAGGTNPPAPVEEIAIFCWRSRKLERPYSPPGSRPATSQPSPRGKLHPQSPAIRPLSALDEQYRQLVAASRREATSSGGRRGLRPQTMGSARFPGQVDDGRLPTPRGFHSARDGIRVATAPEHSPRPRRPMGSRPQYSRVVWREHMGDGRGNAPQVRGGRSG